MRDERLPPPWETRDTEASIPELFERQARVRGTKTAVAGTAWQPSFAELDAAAEAISADLLARNAEPGPVALLMRHDAPLIAAALGVLKAGKASLPLNRIEPSARLGQVRADVEPQAILADLPSRELALRAGFDPADLVLIPERPAADATAGPRPPSSPDDLAFLIHTSGSTGRPNGVMQPHRNVLHNVLRQTNGFGVTAEDRIALLASLSSGHGLATTWLALLNGATLCPFPIAERGVTGLPDWLEATAVSVLGLSASVFRSFVRTLGDRRLDGIRMLRLGSEAVLRSDHDAYRRHLPGECRFVTAYSSSETGNVTQLVAGAQLESPRPTLPVGQPAEGQGVAILDERGDEARPGESGEIVVRSHYLSPGYWRNGELTQQRFRDGCFFTGDLGVRSEDGALWWLGRKDAQVKVRGSSVDLSEVELVLGALPGVSAGVAGLRRTPSGDSRLAAYVVPATGSPAAADLRDALRARLPSHAVPTAFSFVDSFPLNAHGKVDRGALSGLELEVPPTQSDHLPRGGTESLVARVWAEAFERADIGREANFFALGGDSLTAAVIGAGLDADIGVQIELGAFAQHPTVAAMAELVDRLVAAGDDGRPPLVRVDRSGPLPCSFFQERIWRSNPQEQAGWTMAKAIQIDGPLDPGALEQSITRLTARHEGLRTTFVERHGVPLQVIHPPAPATLPLVEMESAAEADELLRREAAAGFDVERACVRFVLVRLSEVEHRLLCLNHHLVADGHSWTIFYDELVRTYTAEARREEPSLGPEPTVGYADFAVFERRTLNRDGEPWRAEVDWWRRTLDGAPPRTVLPFTRRAPVDDAPPTDGILRWGLPTSLSERVESLRRNEDATPFMVRVAAFSALAAALNGEDDLVFGTYATTRRLAQTRGMFGCFTNLLALRLRLEGDPSFREWLAEVRRVVADASAHSQIPYSELCADLRDAGVRPPELRAIVSVREIPPQRRTAGIELTQLEHELTGMPWGFSFQVAPAYEATRCLAAFDARAHDPPKVRSFVEGYKRLLEDVCAEPDRPLRRLLPDAEGPAPPSR